MSAKRVAIVQSSYIPWKGYFDLIRSVDEFILLDDVQFTRRDWRSRNQIKTQHGPAWLTIPVNTRGRYTQLIQDTTISDASWTERHWRSLVSSYGKAPYFRDYADAVESLYRGATSERLSDVNHTFIAGICRVLGIGTPITWSTDYEVGSGRNERLIALCRAAGASEYLSGPRARDYMDLPAWVAAGIGVRFADYTGYPEYPQPHGPFEHAVSVLDLLFCTGPRALEFMKAL